MLLKFPTPAANRFYQFPAFAPIIAVFFVNRSGKIVVKNFFEIFMGWVFKFQAVYQKQNSFGVAGSQEKFNHAGGNKRFARLARGEV